MRTHCITIDLANQGRHQVRARFDGGRMSSDGGALLLQAVDQRISLTRRLFGLALGYEDLCDHDRLRERDRGHPLAGSSTLNRLELGTPEQAPQDRYKRIVADPQRLDALLVELFLDSHAAAPEEIVLDVDATDDPLHGRQEGRFFHPLYVTCGPHLLCGRLRRSNRDAADGAVEELQRIVGKAEWLPGGVRGDNQRLVVTSLERGRIGTQPLHEQLYCARGDMENRIKEQQLDLFADRTSAATRRANQLRLYWALFAAALLEVLRQRGLAGTELARAQCGTIRALLLKVAAVVW